MSQQQPWSMTPNTFAPSLGPWPSFYSLQRENAVPMYVGPWSPGQYSQVQQPFAQTLDQYRRNQPCPIIPMPTSSFQFPIYQTESIQDQSFSNQLETLKDETEDLTDIVHTQITRTRALLEQFRQAPINDIQLQFQLDTQQMLALKLVDEVRTQSTSLFQIDLFDQFVNQLDFQQLQAQTHVSNIRRLPGLNLAAIQFQLLPALYCLEQVQFGQLLIQIFQAELLRKKFNGQKQQTEILLEEVVPALQAEEDEARQLLVEQAEAESSLSILMHEGAWHGVLSIQFKMQYFPLIIKYVEDQRENYPGKIYPEPDRVFAWMRYCAVKPRTREIDWIDGITDVKVVILAQDPYHTADYAVGMSLSCDVAIPPSLGRIFKALINDTVDFDHPGHGDLTGWAKQGVLLLNTVLTVKEKKANSHKECLKWIECDGVGWETFTKAVIKYISDNSRGVVFMLWGRNAEENFPLIDITRHKPLHWCHPMAPRSKDYGKFVECKHFSKANIWLQDNRSCSIDWNNLPSNTETNDENQ